MASMRTGEVIIEAVPKAKRRRGLLFLASGRAGDAIAEARAKMLERTADDAAGSAVRLWWARRGRGPVAAAMVVDNPGRSGMIFHSPTDAAGVETDALIQLIRQISAEALGSGLYFIQSLQDGQSRQDVEMIEAAGYRLLADLTYMRMPLDPGVWSVRPRDRPGRVCWRHHGQFSETELGDLIARTYEGSLDCPMLCGLRPLGDVIEAHKCGGVFRPEAWWIVSVNETPAGCVLVNDYPDMADVVYIGVVPEYRRTGLCSLMLRRAAAEARGRGLALITLAVDAANSFAISAYQKVGFRETDRRLAYIAIREARLDE